MGARTANFDQNNDLVFDKGTVDFSPVRSLTPCPPLGMNFLPRRFSRDRSVTSEVSDFYGRQPVQIARSTAMAVAVPYLHSAIWANRAGWLRMDSDLTPKRRNFLRRIKPKSVRLQVLGVVMVLIVFV